MNGGLSNIFSKRGRSVCGERTMSKASRLSFAAAVSTSLGIVAYVHFKQQFDREQMHYGVTRDVESQQKKKIENLYLLQKQIELTKHLKKDAKQTTEDEVI